MRRAAKVDANQSSIVQILRQLGATVTCLHAVGGGVTDLLIGYRGINILGEIKDPDKPPSDRKLTPDQEIFFRDWRGQKCILETRDDCHALISLIGKLTIAFPSFTDNLNSFGLDKVQLKVLQKVMRLG